MDTFQVGTTSFTCSLKINCITSSLSLSLLFFFSFALFIFFKNIMWVKAKNWRRYQEGVIAKSFTGWVMLIQQLWAFLIIQMVCKELARGLKLVHLYSFKPWTNEQLGNFRQSSLSFLSQGKCTYKKTAFQLIKSVVRPPSFFPLPFSPHLARPRGNQTIKDWMQIYSPSLHVVRPCDYVREGDVLSF